LFTLIFARYSQKKIIHKEYDETQDLINLFFLCNLYNNLQIVGVTMKMIIIHGDKDEQNEEN
jgi:hypothetical protein